MPNVPRHTGSLFLTYDIHNMPCNNTLTFGGGGHGVSRRSATNGADYYLPGYFVADAFAAYKMKLQYPVTLQLNVKTCLIKRITPLPSPQIIWGIRLAIRVKCNSR